MNRLFINLIKLLVWVFSLKLLQCKICPNLITNYNPMVDQGYVVRNFFKIPQTNVLVINTYKKASEDYNVVYYNDMTSKAGEIINVIQPDYIIIDMSYIHNQHKILAMNYDRIIIANPYTLKSERHLSIAFLIHAQMVEKTKFAIATLKQYIINIIDVENMVVIKVLDNIKFPSVLNTFNFYTKCFSRPLPNQYLLMTVNSYGFYTWSIDLSNLDSVYNGYIGPTIVNNTDYAYRQFTKHPTKDIFFVGGANLEILAFEIVDITTQTYRQQMKLNLYNSKYLLNATNIVYKSSTESSTKPLLIVGDGTYVYDLVLTFDDVNKVIKISTYTNPPYVSDFPTSYVWYEMPEEQDKRIIMSGIEYITIYNYYTHDFNYNLFFGTDWQSRRFIYEGNGQSYFAFIRSKSVQYFNRTNLSTQITYNSNMTFKPYYEVNNVYRVKNCNECLFLKTAETPAKNYFMNQIMIYPQKNTFNTSLNVTALGFKWNEVNMNLDPFYYKNQTWVALGFRNKTSDKKYLFTMVNMHNTAQNFNLTGTDEENSRQSSYAIAVVDDPNNLEIVGVDFLGYVYVWDFLTKAMKYSRRPVNQGKYCLNSDIGTIYYQSNKKWLIFVCDDRRVLSYDFESNTTQLIRTLATNPLALKAFPIIGIIAFGDTQTGDAFIYKINDGIFNYFLTIQPGYLKDRVLSIELLSDNTIWIQYYYSNILYSLGDCINDVNDCQKCEQTQYFNPTYVLDSSFLYGNGSLAKPYTSSYSFLTAMLRAQRYQNRISGISGMNVNIIIDPLNKMVLPQEYLNFDFSSIILLNIKSKTEKQLAILDYYDKLEFSNYNYVGLQDISIQHTIFKQPYGCGINFYNINTTATLNNIQFLNQNQTDLPSLNCYQIYAEQTKLQILEFTIKNQNFSNHKSIISTLYTESIYIKNFSLDNCITGDKFSIVEQNSDLKANMKSVKITNNICAKNPSGTVSSLFTAGLFNVEDLKIQNNNFCYKIIFSSVPSLGQQDYSFQFKQIQVLDNSFITKTSYLFFSSLYSILQKPSHSATFLQMTVQNNKLQKNIEEDLQQASFIQTSKILNHDFKDIIFKNHHEISFSSIEYSDLVSFNKFDCINDQEYFDSSPNSASGSCLQLYEIQSTKIQTIRIEYKKTYDYDLISLYNKLYYKLSDFDITDGKFSNLLLNQQTLNSLANPITIYSLNDLNLQLQNCHFFDNSLEVVEDSQTFSTSALWIENQLGTVNIVDSTFKNSTSNSIYNFIFIETSSLGIQNLTFEKSSFENSQSEKNITKQLGGFMNIIIKNLKIIDSQFSKSKSQYGSFIFMQPFGSSLNVEITNTSFSEGYAQVDGGALYIDIGKSQLQFSCIDCFYQNIYTYSLRSSAIGIQKQRITTQSQIHEMVCKGGYIKNIFGVGDNFFTDVQNMKLSFIDIKEIKPLAPISESENPINQQFGDIASQQSTLIGSEYSEINIQRCQIQDVKIFNLKSKLPLLILAEFTSISISDTNIQDGIFVRNAIKVMNGTLSFKNTQFTNIIQQKTKSRQLSDDGDSSNIDISSLIVMIDSGLIVSKGTSFIGTKCYNECSGAVFNLMNTNFNIQQMNIIDSEAEFGGSLFIQGLRLSNKIISSKFKNNLAQIDGGAIYLQAQKEDVFQLRIDNCEILQNNAQNGKGGALFIRSQNEDPANQLIEINDTQFIENIAQIGGGIFQKEISPKILGTTIFKQNVGKTFGNDSLSYPSHLNLTSKDQFFTQFKAEMNANNTIVISNFRSGDKLSNLIFELVNDENEIIRPITPQEFQDFSVNVKVGMDDNIQNYSLRGNVSAPYDSKSTKQFVFQGFDFIGIPGKQATLEFYSEQIYVLDKSKVNKYTQDYSFKIIVNFRNCTKGEIIQEYNSLTECKICTEGKYSYDFQVCHTCPTGATCAGAAQMVANQGYWRKTNESVDLMSCPLLENCNGGSFGNDICYEGHIGALCEECDIEGIYWNGNYAKTSKNSCTNCELIAYNSWFVFFITLWTLISMALAIRGDIQAKLQQGAIYAFNLRKQQRQRNSASNTQNHISQSNNLELVKSDSTKFQTSQRKSLTSSIYYQNQSQNQNWANNLNKLSDRIVKSVTPIKKLKEQSKVLEEERSGIYIKILTNYFQIVSSIATFNLSIPSGIFEFPQSVGSPLRQTMNSLDCFLKDYESSIPYIYLRLLFSLLIPVAYVLVFISAVGVSYIGKGKGKFPWYIISTAIMFLIIYVQPDLVAQMIALMSCREIGGTKYILANVSYECYTAEHYKYVLFFVGPLLAVWVLILPLILFLMLFTNRNDLSKIKIKMKYGFLYKEYKKEAFYWEFIKMIEKICIILSLNFYSTTIIIKALLVFIVIVVYGILSIIIEPFEEQKFNQLDIYSTNVCALSVLLGLFIYQNPFPYFYYSSLGIILLINALFIIAIFKRIINSYITRLRRILDIKFRKLALKIPKFRNYISKQKEVKKIDPVVKEKVKRIFENYIALTDEKKQKVKIAILKSQFKCTITNLFGQYENSIDEARSSKSNRYRKNFNLLKSSEENNLLSRNSNFSPLIRPIYNLDDNVHEDEENQQRRAIARLSVLVGFKFDEDKTDKPLDTELHRINTEEIKEDCSSRNIYQSQVINYLNNLNNCNSNEGILQTGLFYSPILNSAHSEQSKLNDEDANNQQNTAIRFQQLNDCILENGITPQIQDKVKCNIQPEDSKIDIDNKDNHQSQQIKRLQSLKIEQSNQEQTKSKSRSEKFIKESIQIYEQNNEQLKTKGQFENLNKNNLMVNFSNLNICKSEQDYGMDKDDSFIDTPQQ